MKIEKNKFDNRPDFFFAYLLMRIGMEKTKYRLPPLFQKGSGDRFLQDAAATEARKLPIGQLLLDEPSLNTISHNTDLFIKGSQRDALCPDCTLLALYARSQFGGPEGPGMFPGNHYHCMLYFRHAASFEEMVEKNTPQGGAVPVETYFTNPNLVWLGDPEPGECKLCGEEGLVFTSYHRKKRGEKIPLEDFPSPHAARTKKGRRHVIRLGSSPFHITNGVEPDSETTIPPTAIGNEVQKGDKFDAFGIFYDKAKLKNIVSLQFHSNGPINTAPIERCGWAVCKWLVPRSGKEYAETTLYSEVVGQAADLVIHSNTTPEEAATTIFEMRCPAPRDRKKLPEWKKMRAFIKGKAMFITKIRENGTTLFEKKTESLEEAAKTFQKKRKGKKYDGKAVELILSYDKKQLLYHRFDKVEGIKGHFREEIDTLEAAQNAMKTLGATIPM